MMYLLFRLSFFKSNSSLTVTVDYLKNGVKKIIYANFGGHFGKELYKEIDNQVTVFP